MSISVSSKNAWGIATALCIAAIAASGDILTHHTALHGIHGRAREIAPNGDIVVNVGAAAGVALGMDGVVVRTEPRDVFVAKVRVKNVFAGEAVLEKSSGTLAVKVGDHVFLGDAGTAPVDEEPKRVVVAPVKPPPPQEPELERPRPVVPSPEVRPAVRVAPDPRFAGTFLGLWDSTTGGTSYRYPRNDRIGHACLARGSTAQAGGTLAVQQAIPGVKTVLTGDVDGDGTVDIVTCSGNAVSIYDGAGARKRSFAVAGGSFLAMLEDADGDGVHDIFLGGDGAGFAAYVYKGDGTLLGTFAGRHAGGNDVNIRPIAFSNGKVFVGYNAGYARTPRGFAAFDYATATELWYYQIGPANGIYSVADMDGDGKLEATTGSFTVHNGASGNGTTDGDMYTIVVDETGAMRLNQKYGSPSDGGACHVFADLTGDGLHEIIGFRGHDPTHYPGQAKIFALGRDGTILNTFDGPNNGGWGGNGAYAVGDLDGDGSPEIVATASPALTTYVLDASLNKIAETNLAGEVQLIGDLTGDGQKEIVLLSANGVLSVLDRNLNVLSTLQVGTTGGNVIADDINGDGIVDLLCRTDKLYIVGFPGAICLGEMSLTASQKADAVRGTAAAEGVAVSEPASFSSARDEGAEMRLLEIQEGLTSALVQREVALASMNTRYGPRHPAVLEAQQSIEFYRALLQEVALVRADLRSVALTKELIALALRQQELQSVGLGSKHPDVVRVTDNLSATRKLLEPYRKATSQ